jgi:hypothetical protein
MFHVSGVSACRVRAFVIACCAAMAVSSAEARAADGFQLVSQSRVVDAQMD